MASKYRKEKLISLLEWVFEWRVCRGKGRGVGLLISI